MRFNPISPSAVAAPVAKAGATFVIPFIACGNTFAPREASDVNKFPPCLTTFLICVFDIFISLPVPFAIDFLFY